MDKEILLDPTKPLPEGYRRGFYEFNRAWYRQRGPARPDEFVVGVYLVNDGAAGEFMIERDEHLVSGGTWFLKAFDDAWATFPRFADLFAFLAQKGEDATADEMRAGLLALGIVDLTAAREPGDRSERGDR